MPIRFRCPTCDRQLSIARRKVGTQVHCPRCEGEITVPDVDLADLRTTEASVAVQAGSVGQRVNGRPATVRPAAVVVKPGDSGPLFEEALRPAPQQLPSSPPLEEGIAISRGAVVSLAVLMVVLLAMAFATGYLVGTS